MVVAHLGVPVDHECTTWFEHLATWVSLEIKEIKQETWELAFDTVVQTLTGMSTSHSKMPSVSIGLFSFSGFLLMYDVRVRNYWVR